MTLSGHIVALQAQLDSVGDALGAERLRAADGYHGDAVRALRVELCEALQVRHDTPWEELIRQARASNAAQLEIQDLVGLAADWPALVEELRRRLSHSGEGIQQGKENEK